ncbi:MAG: DUF3105 domain-containing protein [Acidimicrobiia bacterium]
MSSRGTKAEKAQARKEEARRRKRQRRRLISIAVALVIVVFVVFAATRPEPDELAAVEVIPNMGQGHLVQGEAPPDYNSNPPTSGRHASSSAECGIYVEEVSDVIQVHNLEHGTIVIQYRPDLPEPDRDALQDYARTKSSHILVAPRDGLETAIAVTAWTRLLQQETVDLDTIDAFYNRFARRGPEPGVPCPFTVDQSLG